METCQGRARAARGNSCEHVTTARAAIYFKISRRLCQAGGRTTGPAGRSAKWTRSAAGRGRRLKMAPTYARKHGRTSGQCFSASRGRAGPDPAGWTLVGREAVSNPLRANFGDGDRGQGPAGPGRVGGVSEAYPHLSVRQKDGFGTERAARNGSGRQAGGAGRGRRARTWGRVSCKQLSAAVTVSSARARGLSPYRVGQRGTCLSARLGRRTSRTSPPARGRNQRVAARCTADALAQPWLARRCTA